MEIARNVQQNLLGHSGKAVAGLDYAGRCLPAGEIGGDYFDFLHLDRGGSALRWRTSPARESAPLC